MYIAAGLPILFLSVILQTTIISRIQVLNGCADIVLIIVIAWAIQERSKGAWVWAGMAGLFVAFYTSLPFFIPFLAYLISTGAALWFNKKIWKSPVLIMLFLTLIGTLVEHFFSMVGLVIMGGQAPLLTIINQITLPSVLLNFAFALPIYALISSLSNWIYPRMEEV